MFELGLDEERYSMMSKTCKGYQLRELAKAEIIVAKGRDGEIASRRERERRDGERE